MVELQHYEANSAASASAQPAERRATAMPADTRLQVALVALVAAANEASIFRLQDL